MNEHGRPWVRLAAAAAVGAVALSGCASNSNNGGSSSSASSTGSASAGCPAAVTAADAKVAKAADPAPAWDGPTTGPAATTGKTVVVVAQTLTNPGVVGVSKGVEEAAKAIGWTSRVIDGQGTPAGIQNAFSQAIALKPQGIVIAGFDPLSTKQQVSDANAAGIPLIGWHAVGAPGPSTNPKLAYNVTTNVEDVANVSSDWIISKSKGNAGVVIFTDSSIPFAENKSQLIKKELQTCSSINILSYSNIPIPDASTRTPQEVSSLIAKYGDQWTYSVAINDLYFADAAPALRAAGKQGDAAPFNIGAGDGDPSAFQRIRDKQYQSATVPEPLNEQGWQIVDEFNRTFAGQQTSGYVAPVHLTTTDNVGTTSAWDPPGYKDAYLKIWGK